MKTCPHFNLNVPVFFFKAFQHLKLTYSLNVFPVFLSYLIP